MSAVINLHETRAAKAAGVFAAVNIAARRMGCSGSIALQAARRAKQRYQAGGVSPAMVISQQNAQLRRSNEGRQA